MSEYVIGVDIGGTKIATGLVSREGKLAQKVVLPTMANKGIKTSLDQVYNSIDRLLSLTKAKKSNIKGIGVCAPGPLDPLKGIVHNPPNLPGWKEVPLAELIRKKFKKRTKIENDANAAGMAEAIWGAAKGYRHIFYVTVSTGIGTAVIIDGKIFHGKNGMAGEGGHVTINYDEKSGTCGCGNRGCIESLASGPYTVKRVIRKIKKNPRLKTSIPDMADGESKNITMVTIGEAAREGDKFAIDAIKEQGHLLGVWLGSMINLLDPEVIVIGGGVSLLGSMLFKEIRKSAVEHTINIFARKTPIVQAKLKRDVGIFGAASILLKR